MMRAAVYHGRADIRVESVDRPAAVGPADVRIRVNAASICGTDLSEYLHGPLMIPLHDKHHASRHVGPIVIGHEFTGTVIEVGSDVDNVELGDNVVPGAGSWCGTCPRCQEARPNLCENYFVYGLHAHGGMAEEAVVPASMCYRVPETVDSLAAAIAQPAAFGLHAVSRCQLSKGETVVVIGAGGIGAFIIAGAVLQEPAELIAVDVNAHRLHHAQALGATTTVDVAVKDVTETVMDLTKGHGADVVIEASGTPGGFAQAMRVVRFGGRVLLVGIQSAPVEVDLHRAVVHEINLLTTNGHVCNSDLPRALELLTNPSVAETVIGPVLSLDALVKEGFEAMATHTVSGKVVVDFR